MKRLFSLLVILLAVGCGSAPPAIPTANPTNPPTLPLPTATAIPTTAPTLEATLPSSTTAPATENSPTAAPIVVSNDPVMVGAGDISVCGTTGAERTAELVDKIPGTVFTLGDEAYEEGSANDFENCYNSTWGRFKDRTLPVPGNHEYLTKNAQGYFDYFGSSAGEVGKGYYSVDIGAWRVIILNSEIATDAKSAQVQWLQQDLAAHPAKCTVAMWHRPLFTSGPHGLDHGGDKMRPVWDVLYANHADLILNGHDHDYERFAPQDPSGKADPANGIREIVVGTGGGPPYPILKTRANSEAHRSFLFGVLKLTLHPTSYDWEFIPVTSGLFSDSGTGQCH